MLVRVPPPPPVDFRVVVKTVTGERLTVDGNLPTDTIDDVKAKIQRKEGIPKGNRRLAYEGKAVEYGAPSRTTASRRRRRCTRPVLSVPACRRRPTMTRSTPARP